MKKISGDTFFCKKLFPSIWFGVLFFISVAPLLSGRKISSSEFINATMWIIMLVAVGYLLFRNLFWDLADEVYANGDELIFRKGGKEQRVDLQDIRNINYSHIGSPERVVIRVGKESPIGGKLAFHLPLKSNPFSKSPVMLKLMDRVELAKNR